MVVALMAAPSFGQLAGYWKFDETSGTTVLDSSGNGKTGILYSGDDDSNTNLPTRIAGHNGSGNALQFNASTVSGGYNSNGVSVTLGSGALVNLGEAFTISMWVRRDAVIPDDVALPGLLYTDAYELDLATNPDDPEYDNNRWDYFNCEINYLWQFSLGEEVTAQKTLGSWYHYAVTYDGNYLRKYVNGILVGGQLAPTTFSISATTNLLIGSRSDTYMGYFTGAIDDVAIWSGKYLGGAEVAKLAAGTITPLAAVESNPIDPLPSSYYTMERDNGRAWQVQSPWSPLYDPSFNWGASVQADNTIHAWWIDSTNYPLTMPGMCICAEPGYGTEGKAMCKWRFRNLSDYNVIDLNNFSPDHNNITPDVSKFGLEWIDPSWSGSASNIAVLAAYITPGIGLCQETYQRGYQAAGWAWGKNYFKTYARVAAVNASNAYLRVRVFTYDANTFQPKPNKLTYLGEVYWPLYYVGDYAWQEMKYAFPKPYNTIDSHPWLWIEISIAGGNANTKLYIDEFNPASNFPTKLDNSGFDQAPVNTYYYPGDFDKDAIVNYDDFLAMADTWLDTCSWLDPRSGGLLTNGDFSADTVAVGWIDDANKIMNPTGWSFNGTGDYGLWRTAKRGGLNYANWTDVRTIVPIGGDVSAFTTDMYPGDPCGVLSQTASAAAVSGQTYYAMSYVMTWAPGADGPWYGWKDTATMTISIDNVVKATFTRRLSMNKWRALYGTYTAVPADAGKPIEISFSYDNTYSSTNGYPEAYAQAGNMFIGYAYLGTTVPNEWPEKRSNLLTNGGFEDLSAIQSGLPSLYTSLTTSDNSGAWFATGTPAGAIPGWVYEVPSSYDMNNRGGIWASAFYGPPIPTPGLNDIAVYVNNDFILGQVVGALTTGTTYYLDAACGLSSSTYLLDVSDGNGANWPSPAPRMRVELWRIPAGVTDGTVIYNAISGGNPSYVKVAEANVAATGDILGSNSGRGTPDSNWQIIGTSYTATSSDTSMYVRIRGSGGASYRPEYAFSDVYLSTQKRMVAGGTQAANISSGAQYDLLGPYNSYHSALMGLCTLGADIDGNGVVNFVDYAIMAQNWVQNWFTNITGTAPWN
jgi:hypothetical protein